MRVTQLCLLLLLILIAGCTIARAQTRDRDEAKKGRLPQRYDPKSVMLMSRNINTQTAHPFRYVEELSRKKRTSAPQPSDFELLLVSMTYPIPADSEQELNNTLQSEGGQLVSYIPHNSYLVYAPPWAETAISNVADVQWVGRYEEEDKLAQELDELLFGKHCPEELSYDTVAAFLVSEKADRVQSEWLQNRPKSGPSRHADLTHVRDDRILLRCQTQQEEKDVNDINAKKQANDLVCGCLRASVKWLIAQPEVFWVESKHEIKPLNKYAVPVVWSADVNTPPQGLLNNFPLKGEGQIIGLSDSGVDLDHCAFFDQTAVFPFTSPTPVYANRKVVMYYAIWNDTIDFYEGHGTHVGASITANCADPVLASYNGAAPLSKLAFVDIGDSKIRNREISLPSSLTKFIYQPVYDVGARIHAEAWGGAPEGRYTFDSYEMDDFAYRNPDFLIVRGAGNSGVSNLNDVLARALSVTTQASAKNVLAVGSARLSRTAMKDAMTYRDFIIELRPTFVANYNLTGDANWRFMPSDNATMQTFCCSGPFPAMKGVCCVPTLQSKLDVTYMGLSDFSSRGPTIDGRIKPDVIFPGEWIVSARGSGTPPNGTMNPIDLYGSVIAQRGTSQATAFGAAAAALVREYFFKGYYAFPSDGVSKPARGFSAPSSLIRAMLVSGAIDFAGYARVDDGTTLYRLNEATTDYRGANFLQGFGMPKLDSLLKFDRSVSSVNTNDFSLIVPAMGYRTDKDYLGTSESHYFCYTAQTAGVVTAALAWTDPPGLPGAFLQLLNDLNLGAFFPPNSTMYGNGIQTWAQGAESTDFSNNIERVRFNVTAGQKVSLFVSANSIRRPSPRPTTLDGVRWNPDPLRGSLQAYSLVITGPPNMVESKDCVQCVPGKTKICPMPNGAGLSKCTGKGRWGTCKPSSCKNGYTTSSWTGKCEKLLSFTKLLLIASGIFILLSATACLPINWYYVNIARKHDREAAKEAASHGKAPPKPGVWAMFSILKPELPMVVLGSVLNLVGSSFSLLSPVVIAELLTALPNATSFSRILPLLWKIIGVTLGEFISNAIGEFIIQSANRNILFHLRNRLFAGIMSQPYFKLERIDRGEMQNRLMVDTQQAVGFPSSLLTIVTGGLIRLVVGIAIALFISLPLTLVFLSVVPVMAGIAWAYARVILPLTSKQLASMSEVSTVAYDALLNLKTVKLYGNEREEVRRFVATNKKHDKHSYLVQYFTSISNNGKLLMIQISTIALLFYGSYLVINFEITSYLLITFFLYAANAIAGVSAFVGLYTNYSMAIGSMARLFEIGNLINQDGSEIFSSKQKEKKGGKGGGGTLAKSSTGNRVLGVVANRSLQRPTSDNRPNTGSGELAVEHLAFRYPTMPPHSMVFRDLNVVFAPAKVHAVIGSSGAGKTTLLNILARLYVPDKGRIALDGVDIHAMDREEFLNNIAVVEQQPKLFNKTVHDNIAYGKLNATEQEVIAAARVVNLDQFFLTLPKKYQTVIGENSGITLSGGQKQRVAIARALLRDPKIILLDEPTSDLDVENANRILDLIFELAQRVKKTIILITHHITSIERANQIYFLQNGRVLEQGTHAQLFNSKGAYFRFLQMCFSFGGGGQMVSPQTVAQRVKTMAKRTQRYVQPADSSAPETEAMVPINEGSSRGGPTQRKHAPSHPSGWGQQQQQPQQPQQQFPQNAGPAPDAAANPNPAPAADPPKKKKVDPLTAMLLAKEGKKEGEVVKVDMALKQKPPPQPAPAAQQGGIVQPTARGSRSDNPSPPPDPRTFANVPEDPNPLYNAPEQNSRPSWQNTDAMMEPIDQPAFGSDYAYQEKEGELDDYYGELRTPNVSNRNQYADEDDDAQQIYELPQIAIGGQSRRYAPDPNGGGQDDMYEALYADQGGFLNPIADVDATTMHRPAAPFGLGFPTVTSGPSTRYGARVATSLFTDNPDYAGAPAAGGSGARTKTRRFNQ